MGATTRIDAAEGMDAATDHLQQLLAPPPRAASGAPLPSYVLSGAADPSLLQQGRAMALQLLFAAITFVKLADHLSWLQLRSIFYIPGTLYISCLALLHCLPVVHRRLRLHLWINPLLLLIVLWGAVNFRAAADAVFAGSSALDAGGARAVLTFLDVLLLLSGVTSCLSAFPLYSVPPVALMPLAAVWAGTMSAGNAGVCRAKLLRHPLATWYLRACYHALAPLAIPLEPLLLAAGIGSSHPTRHCHSVLAALQFWVVALAIPLLVARGQVNGYTAWRAQQRRLDQQRRRDLGEAWGFGFQEPSSSSDDGSSDCSSGAQSPSSLPDAARVVYTQLLQQHTLPPNDVGPAVGAALRARRPGMLPVRLYQGQPVHRHHPADWQYVRALRVLRTLRNNFSKLAALALCASALGAWHRAAFP